MRCLAVALLFVAALVGGEEAPTLEFRVGKMLGSLSVAEFRGHTNQGMNCEFDHRSTYAYTLCRVVAFGKPAVPALIRQLESPNLGAVFAAADCLLALGDDAHKRTAADAIQRRLPRMAPAEEIIAFYLHARLAGKAPSCVSLGRKDADYLRRLLAWLQHGEFPGLNEGVFFPLLQHDDIPVRYLAAKCLGARASPAMLPIALQRLTSETNSSPKPYLALIVGTYGTAEQVRAELEKMLRWRAFHERALLLPVLVRHRLDDLVPLLEDLPSRLKPADVGYYMHEYRVVEQFLEMGTPNATAVLRKWCAHPAPEVREELAGKLKSGSSDILIPELAQLADDPVMMVRRASFLALGAHYEKSAQAREAMQEIESRKVMDDLERSSLVAGLWGAGQYDRADQYVLNCSDKPEKRYEVLEIACSLVGRTGRDHERIGELVVRLLKDHPRKHSRRDYAVKACKYFAAGNMPKAMQPVEQFASSLAAEKALLESRGPLASLAGDRSVEEWLKELPRDESKLVALLNSTVLTERIAAAQLLGEVGSLTAVPALEEASRDPAWVDPRGRSWGGLLPFWNGEKVREDAYPVRMAAKAALEQIRARR